MSFYIKVQKAFDQALNDLASGLNVAWENVPFEPTQGEPWLRPTLLFAPSNTLMVNGAQANPGFYQVDLFYPPDKGPKDLLVKMGEIYDHFKSELTLSEDGLNIYIREITRETPTGGQNGGLIVDGQLWFTGSLGINFNCYTSV